MKKLLTLILVLATVTFVIAGCGGGSDPVDDNTQINNVLDQFCTANVNGDADLLITLFVYPTTFGYGGGSVGTYNSPAEFRPIAVTFYSIYDYSLCTLTDRNIIVTGNTAIVTATGNVQATAISPGTNISIVNRPTSIPLQKVNNEWKLASADF